MEWDKIWALNKSIIDPVTPRYTAINKNTACRLTIENGPCPSEGRTTELHNKTKLGTKVVMYGKELYIEKEDAEEIVEGEKITLMKWGNVNISKIVKETNGTFHLTGTVNESDMDFKKTKKLTWLCADPETICEIELIELGHLINKRKIEEDDKVEDLFNKDSVVNTPCYAEGCVRLLQKKTSFQFERRGYYIVDRPAFHEKPL